MPFSERFGVSIIVPDAVVGSVRFLRAAKHHGARTSCLPWSTIIWLAGSHMSEIKLLKLHYLYLPLVDRTRSGKLGAQRRAEAARHLDTPDIVNSERTVMAL